MDAISSAKCVLVLLHMLVLQTAAFIHCPNCQQVGNVVTCQDSTQRCASNQVCMGTMEDFRVTVACGFRSDCEGEVYYDSVNCTSGLPFAKGDKCHFCCHDPDSCRLVMDRVQQGVDGTVEVLHCPTCPAGTTDPLLCLNDLQPCDAGVKVCKVQWTGRTVAAGCDSQDVLCRLHESHTQYACAEEDLHEDAYCTRCCSDAQCLRHALYLTTTTPAPTTTTTSTTTTAVPTTPTTNPTTTLTPSTTTAPTTTTATTTTTAFPTTPITTTITPSTSTTQVPTTTTTTTTAPTTPPATLPTLPPKSPPTIPSTTTSTDGTAMFSDASTSSTVTPPSSSVTPSTEPTTTMTMTTTTEKTTGGSSSTLLASTTATAPPSTWSSTETSTAGTAAATTTTTTTATSQASTTTTTPEPSTSLSSTTSSVDTTAAKCEDHVRKEMCYMMPGVCADTAGHMLCPLTCGFCDAEAPIIVG